MKNNKIIYRLWQLALMACMAVSLSSCRETFENLFSDDIEEGEEVMFTTSLPSVAVTRATEAEFNKQMSAYTAVSEAYEFTIGMYVQGEKTAIGTGTYQPASTVTKDENDNDVVKYDKIGTLKSVEKKALYWPSTTVEYGFMATAGDETLSSEQNTKDKWLKQDLLKGYGYILQYNGSDGGIDKLDDFNYRTAKEWKKKNKEIKLVSNEEEYKMIPLYLLHQRALITVKLKAGEGVSSKSLWPSNAAKEVVTRIYSHSTSTPDTTAIKPLARWESETEGDTIMYYDAIVEPWDYNQNPTDNLITKISLSGQNYSFYRGNDTTGSNDNYDLAAGKHLTITVTLGRESRKTLMSAYIEDWTEKVTTTICDDHGNAGEPKYIETRDDLIDFLKNYNKAGNVGLVLNDIDLGEWDDSYKLYCTLNLGGWTLKSSKRFLYEMDGTAYLQNGTIQIGNNTDAVEINAAIANINNGTIDDVKITAINGAHATVAGAVVENTGSIIKCHSSIEVSGSTAEYVGGIAAKSITGITSGKNATITGCIVNNRVDGGTKACGGIVGLANGDITNNTFEYGITLLQDAKAKNIVGAYDGTCNFKNNAWPTVADDGENETPVGERYTGIIDSETELASATGSGNRYRLAKDISVSSTKDDVAYELDGNGKTISTSKMIFKNITGQVHDMTINVTDNLVAEHKTDDKDIIAPLAEGVFGPKAEIRNIVVNAKGITIQASNPAGVVVWAAEGAKIVNCEATANIVAKVVNLSSGERKYAGGIVSTASTATISQCVFHKDSELRPATGITGAETVYYGGIVGGIGSWNGETPKLTITDCASFCESYITTPEDAYHGGILGYAQKEINLTYSNATEDCQGNWWPNNGEKISNGVASKGLADGYTVEKTIGKRNAVKPEEKK
jgi:hypothetical protein